MIGEEIFPGVEGLGGDECGFASDSGGLPDDERILFLEASGAEELGPVEAGGFGGEIGWVPGVVGFVDVFAVGEGELLFGDGGLEGEDARGADVRIREAGETEHGADVILVLRPDDLHGAGVGEIVVAVGEFDAALKEVWGVMFGVVEAGGDPDAEEIGGMKVGVVEGVDVGADGEAKGVGEFARGPDGGDFVEVGLEGGEAVGFDCGLVHVGVVEVGDLALVGASGGVGFGRVFDNAGDLFETTVREDAEDADGGPVGRKLRSGDVSTVRVEVKVVARADGWVHVGDGDAGVLRCGWGCSCSLGLGIRWGLRRRKRREGGGGCER